VRNVPPGQSRPEFTISGGAANALSPGAHHTTLGGLPMAKVQYLLDAGENGFQLLGDIRDVGSVPDAGASVTIDGGTYTVIGENPGDGGDIVEVVVSKG